MSIDNTALFRARAKIIQRRQKANTADSLSTLDGGYVSEVVEKKDDIRKPGNTTRLTFQHSNNRSHSEIASNMSQFHVYSVKAAQIRKNISDLNDLIIKHRKDYLTSLGHRRKLLPISQSMGMDERERDCIDSEIDVAIRQCSNLAFSFRTQIKADPSLRANDELPHLLQVVRSLDAYISSVVKIIAELRKIRLKKLNDKRRVSKLLTLVYLYECDINSTAKILAEPKWSRYEDSSRREMMNLGKRKNHNGGLDESKLRRRQNGRSSSSEKKLSMNEMNVKRANTVDEISNEEEEQSAYVGSLSPFETIQLTNENENLFTNLAIQNNEIESIEKQITEIQMLQEAFAEKIMDQEKDIDLINDAAIFSVKNIVDGNQQIREAIQNLASRRIIVLFCIIVLTFTLLFLDWYKP